METTRTTTTAAHGVNDACNLTSHLVSLSIQTQENYIWTLLIYLIKNK